MPSTPRSRGRGPDGAEGTQVLGPMSERQQLALVMQISQNPERDVPTPTEEKKKKKKRQRNVRGETPLHVAAIRGDHKQVKKLLNQGQDPNVPDFAGWTPLHEACSYGWHQVVELLVNGGANPNAKGLDDDTPLHDATTSGNLKMVKFLVDNGAEPFVRNTKGKMPSDYAAQDIYEYLQSFKDNKRANKVGRSRDDSTKKGNANATKDSSKKNIMETLTQGEHFVGKDASTSEKEGTHLSSAVVSSTQDENCVNNKRSYPNSRQECDIFDDDTAKKKKRNEEKELMGKPAPVSRNSSGRMLTGSKPPGPASKTGATPLKNHSTGSSKSSSSKGQQAQGKGSSSGKGGEKGSHAGKSSGGTKGSNSGSKNDRKSPVASPKPHQGKDTGDGDNEDQKSQESSAPKVPPLKIVIPGGGSNSRNEQEGEGSSGQRGSGKGRGSASTLPYVIPCTTDNGHTSDSSDGNDDKRVGGEGGKVRTPKPGQRVLRSHKTNEDKDRTSPGSNALSSNKSPPPSGQDSDHISNSRHDPASATGSSVELHPRKRKLKSSRDSHRDIKQEMKQEMKHDYKPDIKHEIKYFIKQEFLQVANTVYNGTHCNPYQMYLHIRNQLHRRQKALFPVKPKPPKDFNKYLMNRCTYTLQGNVNPEPPVAIPNKMPPQMLREFLMQEKERTRLRIQHLVEKEKLVLAVEQEILRVHGRAERAVANQALPFSVCTMLRNQEVYNLFAPDAEEKRNAQRSRCNGRQINSWLQEVDDKWEKIKETMLRRQHTEAQTLYAVQSMGWEWKLKEIGMCDFKTTPKIDPKHVPQIHVSNFDLPA